MTIRRQLEKKKEPILDLDSVISKGSYVKEDLESKIKKNEWTFLSLRLPSSMLQEIDEALSSTVGISRTGWILQAIQEKLKTIK